MSRTIAVIGATGAQGGSVVRTLLATGTWKVRAITRNPSSEAAQALSKSGADVVSANLDDEVSLEKAFEGAYAIFAVTNFWEMLFGGFSQKQSGEREYIQGMNLARAAARTATLEHYIWSTSLSAKDATDGEAPCPHADYKAEVNKSIRQELPELAKKTTYLVLGYYATNMVYLPLLKPVAMPAFGNPIWLMPCAKETVVPVAGDITHNTGVVVRQTLANPHKTLEKSVFIVSELMSAEQILKTWSEVAGKSAAYVRCSTEEYEAIWGVAGKECAAQFLYHETTSSDAEALWEKHPDAVDLVDIGVKKGELVNLKDTLVRLKDVLL